MSNQNNNEESKTGSSQHLEESDQRKMSFITETVSKNTNWDEGVEGIIKRNLLIGNLEFAAETALKCGRTTEALLIAEAGGKELLDRIKEEYFDTSKDLYVKFFLKSIVSDDFKEIISSQTIPQKSSNWKENVAYLLAYVQGA